MKKFWKWTNLTESNPTERILTLNGTIAEESGLMMISLLSFLKAS